MSLLLLDTHLLIWVAESETRLPRSARALIEDEQNETMFSVASIWEVAIKAAQGRATFKPNARILRRRLLESGYFEVQIDAEHAVVAGGLPAIHKDPFDRMLVAQALVEGATLLTADPVVARYEGRIALVR